MHSLFEEKNTEVVLLADASIKKNWKFSLHTIFIVCPTILTYVFDSYQHQLIYFLLSITKSALQREALQKRVKTNANTRSCDHTSAFNGVGNNDNFAW